MAAMPVIAMALLMVASIVATPMVTAVVAAMIPVAAVDITMMKMTAGKDEGQTADYQGNAQHRSPQPGH
jgi:hypothetical protein